MTLLSAKADGTGAIVSGTFKLDHRHDLREEIMESAFCCGGSKFGYLNTMN
jgi:hypothetical protein